MSDTRRLYERVWNEHENDDWPGQWEYQQFSPDIDAAIEARFNYITTSREDVARIIDAALGETEDE